MALHKLLHGSKMLPLQQKDKKSLRAIEMKFFRRTEYTLFDDKRNEILEDLKVELNKERLRNTNPTGYDM